MSATCIGCGETFDLTDHDFAQRAQRHECETRP